jgi:E3 ubiquitin-protein ligase SHPRH
MIRLAQLRQRDPTDPRRYQRALETLLDAEKDVKSVIQDIQDALADHEVKYAEVKRQAETQREAADRHKRGAHSAVDETVNGDVDVSHKGKGKATQGHTDGPISDTHELDDSDLLRTAAGAEYSAKRGALHSRLRECRVTFHRIKFLQGDVYHVLGGERGTVEDAAYAEADEILRNLLGGA